MPFSIQLNILLFQKSSKFFHFLPECAVDLTVAASIPDRYVPDAGQRMDLYRRIARIRTGEDADDMTDELIDRFGDPPRQVNNLISVALLRGQAAACSITEITQKGGALGRGQVPPPEKTVTFMPKSI